MTPIVAAARGQRVEESAADAASDAVWAGKGRRLRRSRATTRSM
jgi:hypothetical protein